MFVKAFTPLVLLSAVSVRIPVPILADAAFEKNHHHYIEPDVRRYTNVIPPEVCRKIIELGEEVGFPLEHDSIDSELLPSYSNKHSQAIDVMDEDGKVNQPAIFDELRPYIPGMADLIKEQRSDALDRFLFPDAPDDRTPELGWIFYRKYSPESARNSLLPHFDDNMFTVNIALNDDFTGGGLFYVKPTYETNPDWDPDQERNLFYGPQGDGVPELEEHAYTYDWVNSLKRSNTSGVVFPKIATGDALIHNYTVWHAVAPLETGTRYSMVLFFDMHNPMMEGNNRDADEYYDEEENDEFIAQVYEDGYEEGYEDGLYGDRMRTFEDGYEEDDDENENEEEDDPVPIGIQVRHGIRECDVETGSLPYIRDGIDVFWINPEPDPGDDDNLELVIPDLQPGETDDQTDSFPGHEFLAVRSQKPGDEPLPPESRDVLATFVVEDGKIVYNLVGKDQTTPENCLKLRAEKTVERINQKINGDEL